MASECIEDVKKKKYRRNYGIAEDIKIR